MADKRRVFPEVIPDDFRPGSYCIAVPSTPAGDARTTPSYPVSIAEGWADPTQQLLVHVARANKQFPNDGWLVSHLASGCKLALVAVPSVAFALARSAAGLCDWGDIDSINSAREAFLQLRRKWLTADEFLWHHPDATVLAVGTEDEMKAAIGQMLIDGADVEYPDYFPEVR